MTHWLPAVTFTPQPEGGFTVTSPVLPELITEGDSVEEALANAEDALTAVIEAFEDLGRPLPLGVPHCGRRNHSRSGRS
jgi:antitoxin HicB